MNKILEIVLLIDKVKLKRVQFNVMRTRENEGEMWERNDQMSWKREEGKRKKRRKRESGRKKRCFRHSRNIFIIVVAKT